LDRLDHDVRVAVLSAPAGLLLVLPLRPRLPADRLKVGHTRLVQLDVDAEPPPQPLDGDLDVDLREPGEQLLPGLRVALELDRRILFGEPSQPGRHLLLVALRLRGHRKAHHGLWKADARKLDVTFRVEQHVPGSCTFGTAPMSPGRRWCVALCSLPCSSRRWPMRSFAWPRTFTTVVSALIEPSSTRKTLIRPANGSAIVLNTNADVPAPSI